MKSPNVVAEQTIKDGLNGQNLSPSAVTLFTAFGLGRSYIFHVDKDKRRRIVGSDARNIVEDCWKEIFSGYKGWNTEQLSKYDKPLGETATFVFSAENCDGAAAPIEGLRKACEDALSAELISDRIEAVFFTTGVAVLVVNLRAGQTGGERVFDKLHNEGELKEVRRRLKEIIRLCKEHYLHIMREAEGRQKRPFVKLGWSLNRFNEVDRENWEPKERFSYPLFFVNQVTYDWRINTILEKVAGSRLQRRRQSDGARVSYRGSEVYVDWSEALVSDGGGNQEQIERNFIIALASWFALILMNKNSSIFLFEAFVGMVKDKPQSTAEAVHKRRMAYDNVANAVLPIRWTNRRRDLFLLETIHRNWSSDRWKENIEERMKLLALHYNSLEDERNERAGTRLSIAALFITLFALASAIADVTDLAENDKQNSTWLFLGYPLKQIDFHLSVIIPVITVVILFVLLRPKLR